MRASSSDPLPVCFLTANRGRLVSSRPFDGAELRFIRTEMELTQRALAGIIGAAEQTLRLWEKNRDKFMPATAERLLRALYSEALGNNVHIKRMLEKLADLDRVEGGKACFTKKNGWKPLNATPLEQMCG